MTYVYIASAPQDNEFVKQLSSDLRNHNIDHWYDDGQASEANMYSHLQKATHMIAVLSPDVMLNAHVLAALEHAKQHKLERIAVRVRSMEVLPPQVQGLLPLDFTKQEDYKETLDTLIEDLRLLPPEPEPELPTEIMTALYSENMEIRKYAIQDLLKFRTADESLRTKALDELNALVFREQNSGIKTLIRSAIQTFTQHERPSEPTPALPTKEELAQQAVGRAILIGEREAHLWETKRWNPILGGLGILIALAAMLVGGHWAYLIPIAAVALVLPQLNIALRNNGEFEWKMGRSVIGNILLAGLVGGLLGLVLMLLIGELSVGYLTVCLILSVIFGSIVGWLSSITIKVNL